METVAQSTWTKSKLLIKGLIIALLVLLLQIPAYYVKNLVEEREERQKESITEVSNKWAGSQNITGPILVLPYWQIGRDTAIQNKIKHYAYFLPDELTINSTVVPRQKYRGIYKVMLYSSKINLSGSFSNIQPDKLSIPSENILWNEAFVRVNLSDTKGLNDELHLIWNNKNLTLSSHALEDHLLDEGLNALLNINSAEDLRNIHFSADLNINGSQQLLFTPVGRSTTVNLNSSWPHPSFTGDILPQTTTVKDNGFTATWKSLSHNRSFPQEWKDNTYRVCSIQNTGTGITNNIAVFSFGADLFIPVNGYQKTMRSVKYAALCILLTFASFFLIEITDKKTVHPFQYALIGLALVIFYALLLSFSEYIGFNFSYIVASVCTIGLIAWFVKGILSSGRLAIMLSVVLMLMYTYVFTILQLQDYSLLLGSIGLFITLGDYYAFFKKNSMVKSKTQ